MTENIALSLNLNDGRTVSYMFSPTCVLLKLAFSPAEKFALTF